MLVACVVGEGRCVNGGMRCWNRKVLCEFEWFVGCGWCGAHGYDGTMRSDVVGLVRQGCLFSDVQEERRRSETLVTVVQENLVSV